MKITKEASRKLGFIDTEGNYDDNKGCAWMLDQKAMSKRDVLNI